MDDGTGKGMVLAARGNDSGDDKGEGLKDSLRSEPGYNCVASIVPDEYSGEPHPHEPDFRQARRYLFEACHVQQLLYTCQCVPFMTRIMEISYNLGKESISAVLTPPCTPLQQCCLTILWLS